MEGMTKLGVVGAGTMGSGIALAALFADLPITLYDVSEEVLERARQYVEKYLLRKQKAASLKYLHLTQNLADLQGCQMVIEAIPEDLPLKQEIFAQLDLICPLPAILATNTSTLSVTAIASATRTPERVAGMHFFNPAPVLPLVEVVRAAQTNDETLQSLVRLAQKLGKTPVITKDTPGFIVNRVARPFYGEALRLLGEGVASHEEIDQIVREGGGFPMGPFQLMDLIGIDVNFAATRSIFEQTFFEPRFRPHLVQAQMVAQNTLGRKSGRGFYAYEGERKPEPLNPAGASFQGGVYLSPGTWTPGLRELCLRCGIQVVDSPAPDSMQLAVLAAGRDEGIKQQVRSLDGGLPAGVPILCQCADVNLLEIAPLVKHSQRLAGFDGLFLAKGKIATLVSTPSLTQEARATIENFANHLGRAAIWVGDSPALVLPRIVCSLANEAAFAAGEGVADPETIDLAMRLGANYPQGPITWAKNIGYAKVLAVLQHLQNEFVEERYRPAPLLRKWFRLELKKTIDQSNAINSP